MTKILLRTAVLADVPALAYLWLEKMTLLQQTDPTLKLLPNALIHWSDSLEKRLSDTQVRVIIGEVKDEICGFCIGRINDNFAGLWPEKIGVVEHIVLDLHRYHGGLGRELLEALRDWFREQKISHTCVTIPRLFPAEQAFWLAMGAVPHHEIWRMAL